MDADSLAAVFTPRSDVMRRSSNSWSASSSSLRLEKIPAIPSDRRKDVWLNPTRMRANQPTPLFLRSRRYFPDEGGFVASNNPSRHNQSTAGFGVEANISKMWCAALKPFSTTHVNDRTNLCIKEAKCLRLPTARSSAARSLRTSTGIWGIFAAGVPGLSE